MKYLFCLRGCPACGKSTFILGHKEILMPYVLSTDDIRRLYPYMTNVDNSKSTSIYYEAPVWDIYKTCIEKRMQVDDIVILDTIHYKKSSMEAYKDLADKYGFEIIAVDFYSDINIDTLIDRNEKRESYKKVPKDVLLKIYDAFEKDLGSKYKVITKEKMLDMVMNYHVEDTSHLLKDKDLKELIIKKDKLLFDIFPILKIEIDFDQENKYHPKKLWDHTCDVIDLIPKDIDDDIIYITALFHDIGKVYTKTFDANGDTHFFNHGGKSCEIVRNKVMPILKKYGKYSDSDFERLFVYLNHHDLIFNKVVDIDEYYEKGFKSKEEILTFFKLQFADIDCHNVVGRMLEKRNILVEQQKVIANIK